MCTRTTAGLGVDAMNEGRETPRRLDVRVLDAKPCPFCASTSLGFYEYVYARQFAVACNMCGGQGPRRSSTDDALKMWSRRGASA